MKQSINFTLRLIPVLVFLFVLSFARANAQIDEKGGGKPQRPSAPNTPVRTVTRYETKVVVKKQTIVKYQKISGLVVTTVQPNAGIVLESVNVKKQYKENKFTDSDGVLNLGNVPPGKYVLTVSSKGFVTEESEVEVKPQQLVTVPVNLAPITHDIFIKTNVPSGEVRYAPIQKQSKSGVGGYCMVPIKDGNAAILRMQEGDYNLEVFPAEVEYQKISKEITVSEEALSKTENAFQKNEIAINLVRKISTEDFIANWQPGEWKMPSSWKIESKRMQVNSAGFALLQNERYNFYKDFELKTNVRSLDNKSVGFVLRAKDDKNFYLIQLTGAAAGEPYLLTGYIIKNGKVAETLVSSNIAAYKKTIGEQKFFNLNIAAKGNMFTVTLEDVDGGSYIIGIIEDQNNTFPIGAVGIGTKDATRFDINRFFINHK
ncbi:MAG: carboxypeptidase-like regulatory domain-containing protein [Acidobacteriota bacterium]|nr:carboxypeptidase-like regulatory domain-containing protein [Acidobacteriota bacterium]